uniref:Uncharacterized protein n=1 Tax=Rhizophora mucronata TaxID=61149 RepID=A0A2P2QIS1_RHIMU
MAKSLPIAKIHAHQSVFTEPGMTKI